MRWTNSHVDFSPKINFHELQIYHTLIFFSLNFGILQDHSIFMLAKILKSTLIFIILESADSSFFLMKSIHLPENFKAIALIF